MRCPKHDPQPHGDTIDHLRGRVICSRCGLEGLLSNGRPKFGRPRRIIWLRNRPLPAPPTPQVQP